MVGILTIAHGPIAYSIIASAKLFLKDIEQINYVELTMEENPLDFNEKIKVACQSVDTGEGVIILADLLGGTPCNQASLLMNDNLHIISGLNLPMLLEVCTMRLNSEVHLDKLVSTVKDGICHINNFYIEHTNINYDEE